MVDMNHQNRKILYSVILTSSLLWIFFSRVPTGGGAAGEIATPHQGFHAPDITLTTLDGREVSLFELRGRPVILNFWATWCPPCRAEMPAFQKVFGDYSDQGLIILAINSTGQDSPTAIQEFQKLYNLSFPILLDLEGIATNNYHISALPTSFFIDREGVIREVVIGGPMTEALLRSRINKLLDKEP
jgi:cytochrome c biogenesis protein CcmG/thiol:disulfide interchange protein DsbE